MVELRAKKYDRLRRTTDRQTDDKPSVSHRFGHVFFIFPSVKHVNQLAGRVLITGDPLRLTGGKAEGGRGAVRETLEWEIDQNSRVQPNRVHLGVVGRKFRWVHGLGKRRLLTRTLGPAAACGRPRFSLFRS